MADSRETAFKLTLDASDATANIDKAGKAQKELTDEVERTDQQLSKVGANLGQVGTDGQSTFKQLANIGKEFGNTFRQSTIKSLADGNGVIKSFGRGVQGAFAQGQTAVKAFGTRARTTFKAFGGAIKDPITTLRIGLVDALARARQKTKRVGDEADKSGKKLGDMGAAGAKSGEGLLGVLKRVAAAAMVIIAVVAGAKIIKDFGVAAVNAAATAEETKSKFETVFKEAAGPSEKWVQNFAQAAKRSKNEIRGFMADSQAILSGVGMDTQPAAEMSAAMTSLSYDLASFHDLADQDAFDKLRSGMMGNTEGLKTMGIVLNEASISQSMMSMGFKGQFAQLDEASKMQVRFNAILAQTGDAQTDVTRTTDSYTNGLKGVQGTWADFLGDAGAKFTPVLTGLFNTILAAWPKIEPMLMQLVDILAVGLADAIPLLLQLGGQLLPLLSGSLGAVFEMILPIIPLIAQLIGTLLPPLVETFGLLASTILPPLTQIFGVLVSSVLGPLLPIMGDLIGALLPPFVQLLSMVAPILQMLSPMLQMLGQLLVPIAGVLGMFVQSLLPPLMQILTIIVQGVLMPLMPIIQMLITTLLPPVAQLLGIIAPILEMIAPILQIMAPLLEFAGKVLGVIADVLGKIIGWVAGGIGKVTDFFSGIFGGAKKAKGGTDELAGSMADVTKAGEGFAPIDIAVPAAITVPKIEIPPTATIQMPPIDIPPLAIPKPDTAAMTKGVQGALATLPPANQETWTQVQTDTGKQLQQLGGAAGTTFGDIGKVGQDMWQVLTKAAADGVTRICKEFDRLKEAAAKVGNITISTQGAQMQGVPKYARGTPRHPGGPAVINDEGGRGEMVVLPSGAQVIPADQTEHLISRKSSKTTIFAPNITVPISGAATQEDQRNAEERIRQIIRDEYDRLRKVEASDDDLEYAPA